MYIMKCLKNCLIGIDIPKKIATLTPTVKVAKIDRPVRKSKQRYKADYKRFISFMHDNCIVYDGEYANFPDIYDAYLNWECSLNNTKIMEQHAFGHYLTKFTGIKSTTSTIPGKADSWNTIYMGIGLKFPLEQQIRPQFGELYRFRHIWLMETGDFNDCTIIKEIYKRYLQWTKLDSLEPYSFSLFSSRLRKFFNEKKVSFEQICLSGNKLKIIRGVKLI